jgi:hypothetical protein
MKSHFWYQLTENAHSTNSNYSNHYIRPRSGSLAKLKAGFITDGIGTNQHSVDLPDHQWILVILPVPWHWCCVILVNHRTGTAEKCTPCFIVPGASFVNEAAIGHS